MLFYMIFASEKRTAYDSGRIQSQTTQYNQSVGHFHKWCIISWINEWFSRSVCLCPNVWKKSYMQQKHYYK